jgi:hypothetical protein
MEHFNQHRMSYTPKNNWHFQTSVNTCFTSEQFEQLEECYEFSNQDILIFNLGCDMYGDFHFDFDFMGVKFNGVRKLDSVTNSLWNSTDDDRHVEYIEFEMALELLSHDAMNDVYQNHELYL